MNCLQRGIGLGKVRPKRCREKSQSVEATKIKKETPIMPVRKTIITSPIVRGAWLLPADDLVCDRRACPTADPKSPLARLNLRDGDGIVFYGDSITHQRLYTQYLADYFYTRFPNLRLRLHNAGVSGSVAWKALDDSTATSPHTNPSTFWFCSA